MDASWEEYCYRHVSQSVYGSSQNYPRLPRVLCNMEPGNTFLGYQIGSCYQLMFLHNIVASAFFRHFPRGLVTQNFDARSFGVEAIKLFFANVSNPDGVNFPKNESFHNFDAFTGRPERHEYPTDTQAHHRIGARQATRGRQPFIPSLRPSPRLASNPPQNYQLDMTTVAFTQDDPSTSVYIPSRWPSQPFVPRNSTFPPQSFASAPATSSNGEENIWTKHRLENEERENSANEETVTEVSRSQTENTLHANDEDLENSTMTVELPKPYSAAVHNQPLLLSMVEKKEENEIACSISATTSIEEDWVEISKPHDTSNTVKNHNIDESLTPVVENDWIEVNNKRKTYEKKVDVPSTSTIKLKTRNDNEQSVQTRESLSPSPNRDTPKSSETTKTVKEKSVGKSTRQKKEIANETDEFKIDYTDAERFFIEGKKFAHLFRIPERSEEQLLASNKKFLKIFEKRTNLHERSEITLIFFSYAMMEMKAIASMKRKYLKLHGGQPTDGAISEETQNMLVIAIRKVKEKKQCQWHLQPVKWMMRITNESKKKDVDFCSLCIWQKRCVPGLQNWSGNLITMIARIDAKFEEESSDTISMDWFNSELTKLNEADPGKSQPSPMTVAEFMAMDRCILSIKHYSQEKCILHNERYCVILKLSAFDKPYTEHKVCRRCILDAIFGKTSGINSHSWLAMAQLQRVVGFDYHYLKKDTAEFFPKCDYIILHTCFLPPMQRLDIKTDSSQENSGSLIDRKHFIL